MSYHFKYNNPGIIEKVAGWGFAIALVVRLIYWLFSFI
jgi:hypothetical protein